MLDPANLHRYILWVALNGSNRHISWTEICNLEPEEQHDFAICSNIYGRCAKEWQDKKDAEKKMKSDIESATKAQSVK